MISLVDPELGALRPLRREEYEALVERGVFDEEAVELLEGFIVRMPPPHGPEHSGTIDAIADALRAQLGGRARVRTQDAFAAGDRSEPEPDVAVVPPGDYRDAHPREAFLIVEVADSSLRKDTGAKALLYASAGVPEYWVVDLVHRAVEIRTDPRDGAYRTLVTKRRGDSVTLVRFPDVVVEVADVLR